VKTTGPILSLPGIELRVVRCQLHQRTDNPNVAEVLFFHVATDMRKCDFRFLTAAVMKIIAFWDIASYSLIVDKRFRGVYCLHHQGETSETSPNFYQTASYNIPEDRRLEQTG
jgi:hypothetical protein